MLIQLGVMPYYLHQLDRLSGVTQYEVPLDQAWTLMKQLHESLPGYMVPRFAQEVAGAGAKIIYPTYPGVFQSFEKSTNM
jgi:L-lysine 2,3-aminomutase